MTPSSNMLKHDFIDFDLKWAQTLDGQLCDDSGKSKWISSRKERIQTHKIRASYDGILVGAQTFLQDLAQLTVRHGVSVANNFQPLRIILDPRGRVSESLSLQGKNSKDISKELYDNQARQTLLLSPESCKEQLSKKSSGLIHSSFDADFDSFDFFEKLSFALREISHEYGLNLREILVEGGPRLLAAFVQKESYRQAFVSISTQITGGHKNRIYAKTLLNSSHRYTVEDLNLLEGDLCMQLLPSKENRHLRKGA